MRYITFFLVWILGSTSWAQYSRELPASINRIIEIPNVGPAFMISHDRAIVAWINDPKNAHYGKNISNLLRIKTKNKKPGLFFENEFLKYDFNRGIGNDAVDYNVGHLKNSLIGFRIYLFDRK